MAELQAGISYWLSVGIRAVQTFPSFIGNNWIGVLLSFVLFMAATRPHIRGHISAIRAMGWISKLSYTGRALMQTNWRTVALIVGAFYIGNVLTVAFKERSALLGTQARTDAENESLKKLMSEDEATCKNSMSSQREPLEERIGALKQEVAMKDGANTTLQQQNRDQQSTINGGLTQCLTQAIGLLKPETLKITPLPFDNDFLNTSTRRSRWILLVNQPLSPVRLVSQCDQDLVSLDVNPILNGVMAGGTTKLNERTWQTDMSLPVWSQTAPLLVTITWHGSEKLICSFNQR